jgi:hypothetical protein
MLGRVVAAGGSWTLPHWPAYRGSRLRRPRQGVIAALGLRRPARRVGPHRPGPPGDGRLTSGKPGPRLVAVLSRVVKAGPGPPAALRRSSRVIVPDLAGPFFSSCTLAAVGQPSSWAFQCPGPGRRVEAPARRTRSLRDLRPPTAPRASAPIRMAGRSRTGTAGGVLGHHTSLPA